MSAAGPDTSPATAQSAVAAAFAAPVGTSWMRVSPLLAWYRRLLVLAILLPAAALGGVAVGLWWSWPWAAVPVGLAVLGGAAGWLAARSEARSWGYAEGRTDFYLTYGVIVRQLIVVPYGRMQVVDVTSNLLEQALGLATVRVRTAATTADTRIPGLRFDDAVRLRDQLAARSETFSTGL
ncbi:hypothetical protein F4561_000075 [Lipingzhangella halophila]|uniref:YdbS-like PH domain-containing protein n=1 Tax=Lipingzhangella halophila TaxID=1783352 RepID=A0A7W7RCD5_9ACTN|nr:PH domain-containing protein [Lipingzhangella halophila]MBB4929255.1 hypothetical protein [Lipingzhangella halophila]